MDEDVILGELQRAVTAAVAASSSPMLPVAYIDVKFDKPADGKWLEVVYFPNNVQGDFWNNEKNYRGILRLILHWPNNGGGAGPYGPLGLLGSICDYFYTGRVLSTVKISGRPDLTGILPEGDETLYPASIRYESFRKGP